MSIRTTKPILSLAAALVLLCFAALGQSPRPGERASPAQGEAASAAKGLRIVQNGGYPELRIDGEPFFVHSAAFFYYRIPRDLWETSLEHHRRMGINTIDIYIPWNWHELSAGEFDFDGHSNPRRDLRGLLAMIAAKGFKLIARPGPVILNEWRHGGYPAWLLERPEYKMDSRDLLEGRYPPLSILNVHDAEAAAQGWLDNATHLTYARRWLEAVARELAPYSSNRVVRLPPSEDQPEEKGKKKERDISGPLLFVQLDDDLAIGRTNHAGAAFRRYLDALRGMLESGGLDVPAFINPTDMRVSAAGAGLERPIGVMGQWYLSPHAEKDAGETTLGVEDISTIEFYVEELKTQPAFPPLLIEYQAGWYCPADDARPVESPVANTLLSSRLLLAQGLHGLNYFPAQDTFSPAGDSVPWANRYYRWDAALDPDTNPSARARILNRNGALVAAWGPFLAGSHKRADFGVVYPLGAYAQEKLEAKDILLVSQTAMQIERLAQLGGFSSELLDPEYQPVEQLLRDPFILLPVFDPNEPKFVLSDRAQQALTEYVRRGGILLYFPAPPVGEILAQTRSGPRIPAAFGSALAGSWRFSEGRVMESTKDFYSWLQVSESFADNLKHPDAPWAIAAIRELFNAADLQPVVKPRAPGAPNPSADLLVTELVSNEGTGLLGARSGGDALVSITNLSDQRSDQTWEVLSPRQGARGGSYISLHVSLPPHESLLMPLEFPLCSGPARDKPCDDKIIAASSELVHAERDGKTLELSFYTPTRGTVRLHLAQKPSHVSFESISPDAAWKEPEHEFEVPLLRGAAPALRRVLKIQLPYTPAVPEKPPEEKEPKIRPEYDFAVANALKLPLADDVALPSYPPLVILHGNTGTLVALAHNFTRSPQSLDFKVEGPVSTSGNLAFGPHGSSTHAFKLQAARDLPAHVGPDGLLHGQMEVHFGRDRRKQPIDFVPVTDNETSAYQFDFDRDGQKEWILENDTLRLVVSPESGGQLLALVDKSSEMNLTTSVGALRDHFAYTPNPARASPARAPGRYGLFNRPYRAEWLKQENSTALRLSYDAPDVYPFGGAIEKTIAVAGPGAFQVDYRIQLHASTSSAPPPASIPGDQPGPHQSFVAVSSVPARARAASPTRFCWKPPAGSAAGSATLPNSPSAEREMHCEPFTPAAQPLEVPRGVFELELRTPGRPGLTVQWEGANLRIEMKNYSALLELEFPPLEPGGAAGEYCVRYRVLPAQPGTTE